MRVLYVSQNGMAENLGQSQVIPYLRGLSRLGADIRLLSFELPTLTNERREELEAQLQAAGIRWTPVSRRIGGNVIRKFGEAASGSLSAIRVALEHRPDIVHGRSYFATAICDLIAEATRRPALLFDCRGMLGDEYVDGGYWTKERLEYRLLKSYEHRLFRRSDGIVVLTRALAKWLEASGVLGRRPRLEVIPCCVDTDTFRPNEDARERLRRALGIDDAVVVVYSGSLGAWYLEEEMARFAAAVRDVSNPRRVVVVCFTASESHRFASGLRDHGFPDRDVIVRRVPPASMPEHLSVGDIGLSFIKPCFSKVGTSPTKVAEYLACGNILVTNTEIGDQADLLVETESCVGVRGFSEETLVRAAGRAADLIRTSWSTRAARGASTAKRHFGLAEVGLPRYERLYRNLVADRRQTST